MFKVEPSLFKLIEDNYASRNAHRILLFNKRIYARI